MTLEKNKIYKVVHPRNHFVDYFPRDYIIFSPKYNYYIEDSEFHPIPFNYLYKLCGIQCLILINFRGEPLYDDTTSIISDCHFEPLNTNDLNDIRKSIRDEYKYNRKLNMLLKT